MRRALRVPLANKVFLEHLVVPLTLAQRAQRVQQDVRDRLGQWGNLVMWGLKGIRVFQVLQQIQGQRAPRVYKEFLEQPLARGLQVILVGLEI